MKQRLLVEFRGGCLFVGDVPIPVNHGRTLSHDTATALGLIADKQIQGWSNFYRLHTCGNCSQRFIAHYAARTCGPVCAAIIVQAKLERRNRPPQQGMRRLHMAAADGDGRAATLLSRVLDPRDSMTINDACVALGWRTPLRRWGRKGRC